VALPGDDRDRAQRPGARRHGGGHVEAKSVCGMVDGGDLRHTTDYRRVYASVLERWWQLPSERVLQRRFEPVRFIS